MEYQNGLTAEDCQIVIKELARNLDMARWTNTRLEKENREYRRIIDELKSGKGDKNEV